MSRVPMCGCQRPAVTELASGELGLTESNGRALSWRGRRMDTIAQVFGGAETPAGCAGVVPTLH